VFILFFIAPFGELGIFVTGTDMDKQKPCWSIPLLALCALFASITRVAAASPDADVEQLLEMDIRSLMEVEVYSTTLTNLAIHESPGVVRLFTREDFRRFGFRTLKDLLAMTPGVQLGHNYRNHTNVWIRGIQTRYNSKILLLIDGVPIRENYYGHFDVDSGVTLDNVERVEIINGPGSVLYGANAFAGVIRVTTKDAGRSIALDLAAQKGYGYHSPRPDEVGESPHTKHTYGRRLTLEADGQLGEDLRLYGFSQVGSGDPFNPRRTSEQGLGYEHQVREGKRYFMGKVFYDNLTFSLSDNEADLPYVHGKPFRDYQQIHRPSYASLAYHSPASAASQTNMQLWYQEYQFDRIKDEYQDDGSGALLEYGETLIYSRMYGLHADHTRTFGDDHQVTAGIAWLHDESIDRIRDRDGNPTDGWEPWEHDLSWDISRDTFGLFVQDNWHIAPQFTLTAGARYDILSEFDNQQSYRLALNAFNDGGWYAKLLAGTAFRTPNYRELAKEGAENPALQPEQMLTSELQIGRRFDQGDANLTLYHNRYEDFINDVLVPETLGMGCDEADQFYANFARRNVSGLELNATWLPLQRLTVKLAASAILQAQEKNGPLPSQVANRGGVCGPYQSDEQDMLLLSKRMLSLLASYRFDHRLTGGFKLEYASSRETADFYHHDVFDEGLKAASRDHPGSYYLVDLFASADLGERLNLDLRITNLFDEEVYFPRLSDMREYDTELPGRRFELTLRYLFE
jgi:outer membrane receptor for ferrienterochelin and colicin